MNTELSQAEINFLTQVVIPCFIGGADKDILFMVMDRNGAIILASDTCAKHMGYKDNSEIMAKKLNYFTEYQEKGLSKQIKAIQEQVFKEQRVISFIISKYRDTLKAYFISYVPLFNPDGSTLGILSIGKEHNYVPPKEYFNYICSTKLKKYSDIDKIKLRDIINLSPRQAEVLYLLIYGFTQTEIAQVLKITRGTIARIIGQLSIKFAIAGSATKILIKKAIELDFHKTIPTSLLVPRIILVNENKVI